MQISNIEFLKALFAEDFELVHVTDFSYDPNNIPNNRHLAAWSGDYFKQYQFGQNTNQYFTISNFHSDETGRARRRKALFKHTRVIVLDDVKEKLSMVEVSKLPSPSWILESSAGSEQYGYILNEPCTNRFMIENLLDGLVANGLAPDGRDPGMKGVTRYVRLPEGINNKASKLVDGRPFNCQITLWNPFSTVTLEQLAAPFNVNLNAERREQRVDGAANVEGHPLLDVHDVIHIKEVRSDGRFDITCPWVDEHTGGDDSGSAVFTNDDGSIGFKCHHGACQSRTGRDLLKLIENKSPGFGATLASWKSLRSFADVSNLSFMDPPVSFMESSPSPTVTTLEPPTDGLQTALDGLRRERPTSPKARQLSQHILQAVEELPVMDKLHYHDQVCDLMCWSKADFKTIIKDLREQWYSNGTQSAQFFDDMVFIKEQNQFYNYRNQIFYSAEAFQNSYSDQDIEARKTALQEGRVQKVDKLDYAPRQPRIFTENNIVYANTWDENTLTQGVVGDPSPWLNHFDALGWEKEKKHILQWMAYTLQFPENKINHMIILGSGEGCGKDFLLSPLVHAMGNNSTTIDGDTLLEPFNEYLLGTKFLCINETELGDRREATAVSNKLKPLAAAPPKVLRVNQKGIKAIKIRNIVSAAMTTNSQLPIRINNVSRRFFAVWSDLTTRDDRDEILPEWESYWESLWSWMDNGGVEMCIYHLRNCVDLSDFKPASSPPMTEFLRDIREASKSPYQQTIEAFIRLRIGAFASDLVTAVDMVSTLKAGELIAPDSMYCNGQFFTPVKVGLILREMQGCRKLRGRQGQVEVSPWSIRNTSKHSNMNAEEVYDEYERQNQAARQQQGLTVVR